MADQSNEPRPWWRRFAAWLGTKVAENLLTIAITTIVSVFSLAALVTHLKAVWNAVVGASRAVWLWLADPQLIPRGIVFILLIVITAVAVGVWRRVRRQAVEQQQTLELTQRARIEIARELAQCQDDIKEMQRIRAAEARPRPISLDSNSTAVKVLRDLSRGYPQGKGTHSIARAIGESFAITEQTLEALARLDLTRYFGGTYTADPAWYLTTGGRDYCIEQGL